MMKSTEFDDDVTSNEGDVKVTDDDGEAVGREEHIHDNTTTLHDDVKDVMSCKTDNNNSLYDDMEINSKYIVSGGRSNSVSSENNNNNNNNSRSNNNDINTISDSKSSVIGVNKSPNTHRLTFGIDSILKEEAKPFNNDYNHSKYIHSDLAKENQSDKPSLVDYSRELNGPYNTSDEEDNDADDFRLNPVSFESESARARLALLRYSAALPAFGGVGGGNCMRPAGAAQQTVFPPSFPLTNTGSGGLIWPSAAATGADGRKDRFGFVRRVGHPYQNRTPPKRKKPRTSFTRLQILELEKRFERQKYLASTERSALAKSLKMTDAQVKTWFQNRRTKWRRQTAEEREIERQAANRLLMSLQSDPAHRKSVVLSTDPVCLSHFQRWQDQRPADV